MSRSKFWVLLGLFLSACVGVHLDVKKEEVLGAGPYHRTLVVSLASTREARATVQKAFRGALWGAQQDPGTRHGPVRVRRAIMSIKVVRP